MMYLGQNAVGIATSIPEFGNIAKIECGVYIPTEDELASEKAFIHSFGNIPDFLLFFTFDFLDSNQYDAYYLIQGSVIKFNNNSDGRDGHLHIFYSKKNTSGFTNASGSDYLYKYFTNSNFYFPGPSGSKLKANTPYYYIIGKSKEVTPNA